MAIDEINLKHLNSDKWLEKISKGSSAFKDIMIGLNFGVNSVMDMGGSKSVIS